MTPFAERQPLYLPHGRNTPAVYRLNPESARKVAWRFWNIAPQASLDCIFWDLPGEKRRQAFLDSFADSLAFAGYQGHSLAAVAWFAPVAPGARCAVPHFSTCLPGYSLILALGMQAVAMAATEFDSLLALIPRCFYGARKMARALGFTPLGLLPGSCLLRGRPKAGELLSLVFRDGATAGANRPCLQPEEAAA